MTTAAIMQPTYLPWIGYLDLADHADVFVMLDNVQFSKQSWQQRNRIGSPRGPIWLTVPVDATVRNPPHIGAAKIRDVDFVDRHLGAIRTNYRRTPGWARWFPVIEDTLRRHASAQSLGDLNCGVIADLARHLCISTPLVRASELVDSADRTGRLVDLCRAVGADTYISPPGAAAYLAATPDAFTTAGIELVFHSYDHPVYAQPRTPFVSHLSIVDALLCVDDGLLEVIRSGRREDMPAHVAFARAQAQASTGASQ